ncbi:MAG: dihydrofolate reductase family protein [Acidobacteriota bacterium]|nr:dihydrofolate reductase family protein [Acidobacteriota bacterium]
MRKVILSTNVTLDGFIEGPNGELDWMMMDEEIWKEVKALLSTVDTTLFGRVTYQGFESYWSSVPANPESPKGEVEFAHWIEKTSKIVFSKTLEKAEWNNSRLVKENIAEEISKLKGQPGKDILMFGGAGIVQTFMRLGLIDDYRINIYPIVLGSGISLFKNFEDRMNFKLLEIKTFNSGVVGLHYQPDKKE